MNNRWRAIKRYKKGRSIVFSVNSAGGFVSSTERLRLQGESTSKAFKNLASVVGRAGISIRKFGSVQP